MQNLNINNCKNRIRFLINGMKNKKKAEIPLENFLELWGLMDTLQKNVSGEEYIRFLGKCFGIDLKNSVEQAEEIIKNLYKNRGSNDGRN